MKIVSATLLSLVATVSADPSLCLDGVNVGYSDATTLAADLINPQVHAANGGIFAVCPFSQMMMTETLFINQSQTTLQCGPDGTSDNMCYLIGAPADEVMFGGSFPWQVAITDDMDGNPITDIVVSGFEMVGLDFPFSEYAANIAVIGSHDEASDLQVSIKDCHIYGNTEFLSIGVIAFNPSDNGYYDDFTFDDAKTLDDVVVDDAMTFDDTITLDDVVLDDAITLDDVVLDDAITLDDTITLDDVVLDDAITGDDTITLDDLNNDDDSSPLIRGMTTHIYDCHFYTNTYSSGGGAVVVDNSDVTIESCAMLYNLGGAYQYLVTIASQADVTISNNCIQSQGSFDPFDSTAIIVTSDSTLTTDGTTYGRGNRFACSGIFYVGTEECEEFTVEQCNIEFPDGVEPECYNNESLNIGLYYLFSSTYEYKICPGTILNTTVSVMSSDVSIQCDDNCSIDFGNIPSEDPMIIVIDDFFGGGITDNVEIIGMQFRGYISANFSNPVLFANSGSATMIDATFDNIMAEDNAIFLALGGAANLTNVYVENSAAAAMIYNGNGTMMLMDSCFVDNSIDIAMVLSLGSGEISNMNNYESGTAYLNDIIACGGIINSMTYECDAFDAEVCSLTGETSPPVVSPGTDAPVVSPVSLMPVPAPVSDAPVAAPVTGAPVAAPVATPVAAPVASSGILTSGIGMKFIAIMIIGALM